MRARFGSGEEQRRFFQAARPFGASWRVFSQIAGEWSGMRFTDRAFRHWYSGERLPPSGLVESMHKMRPDNVSYWERIDENWGQRKGGIAKVAKHGTNLDLDLQRRGGKRSAALLKWRLKEDYSRYWSTFSAKGGISTLTSKVGLLRKSVGPLGERMFNDLEVAVARLLSSRGIPYEYEPKLTVEGGVMFPDFLSQNLIIECTGWTDSTQKAKALLARIEQIHERMPLLLFLVITTDRVVQSYRKALGPGIKVLTVEEFGKELDWQVQN